MSADSIPLPPVADDPNRAIARHSENPASRILARIATFPVVICSFIVLKVLYFSIFTTGISDADIFWQMRDAQFMVANHRFPSVDTYSFTAYGLGRLDYEWLSELAYYGAFRALHWQGIFLFATVLLALICCGVFYLALRRSNDPLAAGLATMLGTALMVVGFGPRMHDLGWLCFLAIFAILEKFRFGRSAPLWAIPILFCLWVNVHGSWPFGLAVFAVIFLAGLIPSDWGRLQAARWSPAQRNKLLMVGAATIPALFINPFGYKLLLYPADLFLHQPLMVSLLQEWAPVNFGTQTGLWVGVTIALLLVTAVVRDARWRIDDLLLTILLLFCGLSHVRMLFPAGIVLPTVLAPGLTGFSTYDPSHERKRLNLILLSAVVVSLVFLFPSERKLQHEIDDAYPSQAVNFLRSHGGSPRLMNEFDWGAYIGWVMPEQKVFIDSRTDIFEYHGVLQDLLDLALLKRPAEILQQYRIDTVLIRNNSWLAIWLDRQPSWRREFKDAISSVYVRNQEH